MGLIQIVELISGVFKFTSEVMWLIRLLKGTPEAHREEVMKRIQEQANSFAQTGRPTWG